MTFTKSEHPTETQLEQFAQFQEELDKDVFSAIAVHLRTCPACKGVVDWFRLFYQDFWSARQGLNSGDKAFVIPLVPYKTFQMASMHTPIVLAAMSSQVQRRFVRLATLYSEQEGVIVRLLRDEQENVVELYLNTREPLKAPAIVEFPQMNFEIVTNEQGRANFTPPGEMDTSAWSDTSAVVHLPVRKTKIHLDDLRSGKKTVEKISTGKNGLVVEFRVRSDQLLVHCLSKHTSAESVNYLLLSTPDKRSCLLNLNHGMGLTTMTNRIGNSSEVILYH
ncbi:MAG TPA: hypothetical protein VKA08_07960 [Balneolales bacterium]|nr:hypothetical protein [Balneolales bacterium]